MAPSWDTGIFRGIHHGWHHPALDPVMKALTDPGPWKVPLFLLACGLFLSRGRRGVVGLLVLVLTLAASDQLSSKVLKPIFRRSRPSVELADTRPLFGVRRSYSFPSGHATNFFAAVPVVGTVFPQGAIPCAVLASAVSLSRVYVGDHYPSDVLAGALLGVMLGFLGRKAFLRLERTIARRMSRAAPAAGPERAGGGAATGPPERKAAEAPSGGP